MLIIAKEVWGSAGGKAGVEARDIYACVMWLHQKLFGNTGAHLSRLEITMRTIEVGAVKIHLEEDEETVVLLEKLLRPLSNKEVAAMIGISERTVMRWKRAGRLPSRDGGQVFMMDLIRHVAPENSAGTNLGVGTPNRQN